MSPQNMFESSGKAIPDAQLSQMFGKPCFKTESKAFVCFFQDCMVFKLSSDTRNAALELQGATLFDPSGKGRAMKEWVQVPADHADKWPELTQSALKYVRP